MESEKKDSTPKYPQNLKKGVEQEYQDIVDNPDIFMDKLKSFLSAINPTWTHPRFFSRGFGGTPLNLHKLFVEVTSRGGLAQVIEDGTWNDVKSVFPTKSPCPKGALMLYLCYLNMLKGFEQTYFPEKEPSDTQIDQIKLGGTLSGIVEEKLENGCVISVQVGNRTLKGMLKDVSDVSQSPAMSTDTPSPAVSTNPQSPQSPLPIRPDPSMGQKGQKRARMDPSS